MSRIPESVIKLASPWMLPREGARFTACAMAPSEWRDLQSRAAQGDADAEERVAAGYYYGCVDRRGRPLARRSVAKAAVWYRRLAERGGIGGQVMLGVILGNGEGVRKDPREALLWLKGAFRAGDRSCSPNNIAITYRENGRFTKAIQWFRKAATFRDDSAKLQIGIHLYWGKGIRTDHAEAVRIFRKATGARFISESERDDAFFYLAVAYFEGKGVRMSLPTARKLLERANRDDDHPAARRLLKVLEKRT